MTDSITSPPSGILLGGKYRLGAPLGEGGMGSVFQAENVEIGLKVAIKQLHPEYSRNREVVERFRREARLAASIGHGNICEVIDFGSADDGTPYLVMPRLSGTTLSDLLLRTPVMAPFRIVDIIAQTLSGLQAAHDANIVHRDLKPENLFITKVGDRDDFVKILDFGISKIMDQESAASFTRTGSAIGTPYYMSPEQARGEKTIDQRTDLWALGVILYEALAGKRPFTGDSVPSILYQICNEPLPPLSAINPNVTAPLAAVVQTALQRTVTMRFQSAEAMRRALLDSLRDPALLFASEAAFNATLPSIPPAAPPTLQPLDAATLQPLTDAAVSTLGSSATDLSILMDVRKPRRWGAIALVLMLLVIGAVSILLMRRTATPPTIETALPEPPPADISSAQKIDEPLLNMPAAGKPEEASPSDTPKVAPEQSPKPPPRATKATTSAKPAAVPSPEKEPVTGRYRTEIDPNYE